MEINRLNQDELTYELKARGMPVGKIDEMRVSLREALRVERDGTILTIHAYPFTFAEDIEALKKKWEEIRELLGIFEGDLNSSEYKKILTKIEWALKRLEKTKSEDEWQRDKKAQMGINLLLSLGSLKLKAESGYEEDDSSDELADMTVAARAISSGNLRVPIQKWEVKFSGEQGQSLNSFLERVDELSEARGVSKDQLFRSALDLFTYGLGQQSELQFLERFGKGT